MSESTYTKHCAECGESYSAKLPIRAHESKYCSDRCRWKNRKRAQRIRDKYNEYSEMIEQIANIINKGHTGHNQEGQ